MNTPKLSIIVPVYNVEQYLHQCLDSFVNQTLQDIEIICINDGSTDKSLEILESYAKNDSRITVLMQENQGQSSARNYGISQAKGEYLGFVDSDDWVDLYFFEKLYNAASENDCDIACAGIKRCGKFFKSVRKNFVKPTICSDIEGKVLLDNLPEDNYIWNKIYRRSKWDFEFYEGRYFEDVAITIHILATMGKMVTVPNTYYNYRKNPTSTVNAKTSKHEEDLRWARKQMYYLANLHNVKLKDVEELKSKTIFKLWGIPILKITNRCGVRYYKLFGFLPFITKVVK